MWWTQLLFRLKSKETPSDFLSARPHNRLAKHLNTLICDYAPSLCEHTIIKESVWKVAEPEWVGSERRAAPAPNVNDIHYEGLRKRNRQRDLFANALLTFTTPDLIAHYEPRKSWPLIKDSIRPLLLHLLVSYELQRPGFFSVCVEAFPCVSANSCGETHSCGFSTTRQPWRWRWGFLTACLSYLFIQIIHCIILHLKKQQHDKVKNIRSKNVAFKMNPRQI